MSLTAKVFVSWSLILSKMVLTGCATKVWPFDSQVTKVKEEFRHQKNFRYPLPLPQKTLIYFDEHFSDGTVKSQLRYIGWDLNHDGRLEMIDDVQTVQRTRHYDFDGDGAMDKIKVLNVKPEHENEITASLLP